MKQLKLSCLLLFFLWEGGLIFSQDTDLKVFPGADEKTPSRSQYFSWINNTNEGSTEEQTLKNLAFFQWLNDEYGMVLPAEKYGESAVSRGDMRTRLISLRNLDWNPVTYSIKLDEEIGLERGNKIELRQYHPTGKMISIRFDGNKIEQPWHRKLGDLHPCPVPEDAEAFYEATCFALHAGDMPRPEYPRPQFERSDWINLNGEWTYVFDFGRSGSERGFTESKGFDDKILVPFCPESKLSGVEHKDFIEMMWYHRKINVPESWKDKKVLLHFGAVDYECEVFIDGKSAGIHYGGTSSFYIEITRFVRFGEEQDLVVYVKDELRSGDQPKGKQSRSYKSRGIMYTRTTGIWQTVWMEPVSAKGLLNCFVIPDLDQKRFIFQPRFHGLESGQKLRISIMDHDKQVARKEIIAADGITCEVPLKKPKTWSPEDPFLYDIVYQVITAEGDVADEVKGYAGMRKVHVEGNKVYLNNKPVYLRLVLDQGFYPGGVWTAPSDADLKRDIELSMKAGFNGARLHQKVFEERFHYWADKLGYLTWGESSSFGMNVNGEISARNFLSEWEEIVERDRNHPSIITWTPFNETSARTDGRQHDRLLADVYDLTKNVDPTRPVNDASGYVHVKTDIWTIHLYQQDPVKFKEILTPADEKGVYRSSAKVEPEYAGQPYIVDEFGGLKWIVGDQFAESSWGYGKDAQTEEDYFIRLEALTDAILSFDHIVGYCYTQLTDVEQEQNGVYNYDRSEKFDSRKFYRIFSKTKELE